MPTGEPAGLPALIYLDGAYFGSSRPAAIAANLPALGDLPFDGLSVSTYAGDITLMAPGSVLTRAELEAEFAPIAPGTFDGTPFQHNFARINTHRPGDLFDDAAWAATTANFALFADVIQDFGFEGIFFDTEDYDTRQSGLRLYDWPQTADDPTKTGLEYIDQARLRGFEIMTAMLREFPDMALMALHGPSDRPFFSFIRPGFLPIVTEEAIYGAFGIGMWQATIAAETGLFVDGAEEYGHAIYDTYAEWDAAYQAGRHDYPLDGEFEAMLPDDARDLYADTLSRATSVYDSIGFTGQPFRPADMRAQVAFALARADDYSWYFSEQHDWLVPAGEQAPNGVPAPPRPWIEALRDARADAAAMPRPLVGGLAAERLVGGAGDDSIEASGGRDTVRGGDGRDQLRGGSDADRIIGGDGADTLVGDGGADTLAGGNGGDILRGGEGGDLLRGGAGADRFVFRFVVDSTAAQPDRILDFSVAAGDVLDLGAIYARGGARIEDTFDWIGAAAFTGRPGQLRATAGLIEADVSGDGAADLVIRLTGDIVLGAANIVL